MSSCAGHVSNARLKNASSYEDLIYFPAVLRIYQRNLFEVRYRDYVKHIMLVNGKEKGEFIHE